MTRTKRVHVGYPPVELNESRVSEQRDNNHGREKSVLLSLSPSFVYRFNTIALTTAEDCFSRNLEMLLKTYMQTERT